MKKNICAYLDTPRRRRTFFSYAGPLPIPRLSYTVLIEKQFGSVPSERHYKTSAFSGMKNYLCVLMPTNFESAVITSRGFPAVSCECFRGEKLLRLNFY